MMFHRRTEMASQGGYFNDFIIPISSRFLPGYDQRHPDIFGGFCGLAVENFLEKISPVTLSEKSWICVPGSFIFRFRTGCVALTLFTVDVNEGFWEPGYPCRVFQNFRARWIYIVHQQDER